MAFPLGDTYLTRYIMAYSGVLGASPAAGVLHRQPTREALAHTMVSLRLLSITLQIHWYD